MFSGSDRETETDRDSDVELNSRFVRRMSLA